MTAATQAEDVPSQNGTQYGLTAGLHSLDDAEIAYWLEHVEAGNLYVNRHITGAVVRRQPFGGWKASSVGSGAKAGGPNYVAQIGHWLPDGEPSSLAPPSPAVLDRLAALRPLLAGPSAERDLAWLRRAAGSDAHAWSSELGREQDPSGLAAESNVLRYRPVHELWVRGGEGSRWVDVARVVLAAACANAPVRLSIHPSLPELLPGWPEARAALTRLDPALRVESDVEFAGGLPDLGGPAAGARVRVVGDPMALWSAAAAAGVHLVTGPVLATGRREMLAALREQTVSRTRHRFGHLPPGSPAVPA
jgi:RHH-type proline utilization regulon transcriptional repressor/proline dehydrogenase/delta 1-pyrroline-5-carboxylate dehydrogenase